MVLGLSGGSWDCYFCWLHCSTWTALLWTYLRHSRHEGRPAIGLICNSVAISGQTAVVGTCAAELAEYIGQEDAYVFAKYPDGMWFQEAKLGPEDRDVQTFTFSPTIRPTTSSPIVCAAIELNLCCKCTNLSQFLLLVLTFRYHRQLVQIYPQRCTLPLHIQS